MSVTSRRTLILALATSLALPLLAAAETYTITLHNGNVFVSRYQPQAAPWDAAKVLFRTDAGNLISLASADVASVVTDTETHGFGKVLNGTTLMLGAAPNDLPVPPAPGSPEAAAAAAAAANAPAEQAPAYTVNQFVEPGSTQGLPGGWMGGSGYGAGPSAAPQPPSNPPGHQ